MTHRETNFKTTVSVGVLASFRAATPNCLLNSTVKITVNGAKLNAFVDTGSCLSFNNYSLVKKCIQVLPYCGRISVANSSLFSEIIGQYKVDIEIESYMYSNTVI